MTDGWSLTSKLVRWTAIGCLVALVLTGIPLLWLYTPRPSPVVAEQFGEGQMSWLDLLEDNPTRELHRVASWLLVTSSLAWLLLTVVRRWVGAVRTGMAQIGLSIVGFVVVVVAGVTGRLVAWDQLGLWAVTVGDTVRGALAVARDNVRFAIVDGSRISPGEYLRMLAFHAVAVPLLGLVALVLHRRRHADERA